MTNSADPDQLASSEAKPTDLDLHSLLRQGMSWPAREGLRDIVDSNENARQVTADGTVQNQSPEGTAVVWYN